MESTVEQHKSSISQDFAQVEIKVCYSEGSRADELNLHFVSVDLQQWNFNAF